MLVYPVMTMRDGKTQADARKRRLGEWPDSKTSEAYSRETRGSRETPPVLLIHAVDDESVPVTHSMAFFSALREQKVPVELHFYERGGHGFGMRNLADSPLASWPMLVTEWLRAQKTRTLAV